MKYKFQKVKVKNLETFLPYFLISFYWWAEINQLAIFLSNLKYFFQNPSRQFSHKFSFVRNSANTEIFSSLLINQSWINPFIYFIAILLRNTKFHFKNFRFFYFHPKFFSQKDRDVLEASLKFHCRAQVFFIIFNQILVKHI